MQYYTFSNSNCIIRLTLVTDASKPALANAVRVNQDVNISVIELTHGTCTTLEVNADRQGYLLCIEGSITVSKDGKSIEELVQHDAAEVYGASTYTITSTSEKTLSHLLLVEMKYTGAGRTDL